MKISLSVTELTKVFKEMQAQPERILEVIRTEMNQGVGEYLSELMRTELSHFLGPWRRNGIHRTPPCTDFPAPPPPARDQKAP
jgi:hypothetical protein